MYSAYQPTDYTHSIVALVFYILMVGFLVYSLISLYALIRYGRNRVLTLVIAIVYLIIAVGLYAAAVANL